MAGIVQVLYIYCFSSFRSLFKYHPFSKAFLDTPKIAVHFSSALFFSKIIINIWQTIYITYYVFIVLNINRQCKFYEGRDFRNFCLFCSLLIISVWKHPWQIVEIYDIVICKKYIFGHSDDQSVFFTCTWSLSKVPGSQLPKSFKFPKCSES